MRVVMVFSGSTGSLESGLEILSRPGSCKRAKLSFAISCLFFFFKGGCRLHREGAKYAKDDSLHFALQAFAEKRKPAG